MFTKRHYIWLASFAKRELTASQKVALRDALMANSPTFNPDKFDEATGYAHGVVTLRQSATP